MRPPRSLCSLPPEGAFSTFGRPGSTEMTLPPLLFMRHGATALNAAGLRCGGDVDLPLTDAGHRQSLLAAQRLAEMRPRVGVIVVSALQRTRQTADIVARVLHGVEIVVDPALDERRLGAWNRRPIAETQAELAAGVTPPGGESNADFTQRIRNAALSTVAPLLPRRVLLIGSKGVARVLGELTGLGSQQPLGNTDVVTFDLSLLLQQRVLECAA
jgi:2,3-bisphosphoglycerate-dependent phosphoglycerate mutase